jgi:hypothetical protein
LIDDQLIAYRARNLADFLSFYSTDVLIEDGDGNVVMRGREGLRDSYGDFFSASLNLHLEIPRRIEIGDFVIDEELIDGIIIDGDLQPQQHVVTIYRVTDSQICHVTFFR